MEGSPGLAFSAAITCVLTREGKGRADHSRARRDTEVEHRGLKMLAWVGTVWPQTKECWKLPEAGRNKEQILPWSLHRECDCQHLDFGQ